ncbi:MAG: hypothetical protein WA790_12555 [Sulfitobacter sp.]
MPVVWRECHFARLLKKFHHMLWSQKIFGVSLHLEKLENGLTSGYEIRPEEFSISDEEIRSNDIFVGRMKHMAIMSEDYAQKRDQGTVLHKHRKSGELIMSGTVRNQAGLRFEQDGEIWWCKLPNRAAFTKWRQCEITNANRHTQKFVMFYLSREGARYSDYRTYPFDKLPDIDNAETLAAFLNGLGNN